MADDKPDPRFKDFIQVVEDGRPIGFKIEGCNYLFKYDSKMGWHDEDNNYYNSKGVFQYKVDEWEDDQDKVQEVLVNQMEELIKKEEGDDSESESEESEEEPAANEAPSKAQMQQEKKEPVTLDEKILHTAGLISSGKGLRESKKNSLVRIYLRMKKQREIKKVYIDSSYAFEKFNASIKSQRSKLDAITNELKHKLPKEAHLNFSVQDGYIYWFGFVVTKADVFSDIYNQLLKDEDFGILKKRTLLHLRFFLDSEQAKANQTALKAQIQQIKADCLKLKFTNIPQFSPVSYVADLLEECGLQLSSPQAIRLSKDHALVELSRQDAQLAIELDGFEKDQCAYIRIEIVKEQGKLLKSEHYEVNFEDPTAETATIQTDLLLESDINSIVKSLDGKMIVHVNVLRQIIMYRENKFVPISAQRFVKK